jgi:hypothetical protein
MTRAISTSIKPLGYYVTVPPDIEEVLGSHFENLRRCEQYTLLAIFAFFMAVHANNDESEYTLLDAYLDTPGDTIIPDWAKDLLPEIEKLSDGTIIAMSEALISNLHYTRVVG